MNKLAFTTLACPDWSVPQVIEAAGRYGYDGVELRLIDGETIEPTMPREERERIGRLFAAANLPIVCVDSSIRVATGEDPGAVEQTLRGFLQLASEWRSPLVRVFGGPWPEGRAPEEVYNGVADLLARVTPEAERLGVAVALETHDTFSSAAAVAEVLRREPSRAFGALWDTHHPYRTGESPDQVLDLLGERVLHVHVKDARRNEAARTGWDLLLLGEGEVPVRESLAALTRRGYDGWVAVEWEKKWHPQIPGPEVALPQHAELLRQWLA
jgi:sugar phosphate isomerase/epimerase